VHAREEKVVEFIDVEEEEPEVEEEKTSDVEFLSIEDKKEVEIQDDDVFEVEKVEKQGPEFIQVKPKEDNKEEFEEPIEEKNTLSEEITEWEQVEKKEEIEVEPVKEEDLVEIEKEPEWEPVEDKEETEEVCFCTECGVEIKGDFDFCPSCGNKKKSEKDKKKQENEEVEESAPTFIPVKSPGKIEEKDDEPEWEPEEKKEETIIKDEQIDLESTEEDEIIDEIEIEKKEDLIDREVKIEAFKDMESIDAETAILLYDNGYTTADFLQEVTIKDLTKIKGLKRKIARKIIKEIEDKIIEAAKVKSIETGDTAEGEITEDQIEEEVPEEEDHTPKPVELSAEAAEWEPANEEEIDEESLDDEREVKIEAFKDMESIDAETAILLYDNGYLTIDELSSISVKDLTKIKGIKKNTAKRIRKELDEKTEWEPLEIEDEEELFEEDELAIDEDVDEKIMDHEPEILSEEDFFEEEEIDDVPPIEIEKDETFKDIKSIDEKISKLLIDNGIKSIDELKKANIKDLTKIRGIRKKIAKQIKKEVSELNEYLPDDSFERGENPFIEDSDDEGEWESFEGEKISDETMTEIQGYMHGDYTLYEKEIENKSGKKQTVRFFSKGEPDGAEPIQLPNGFEVKENKKTGVPYLKKKK